MADWCDIHDCEYTYVPGSYPMCQACCWEASAILDLMQATALTWEEARDQYVEGYRSCEHCGYCKTPNKCVWSVVCPTCGAPPGIGKGQCFEGGRKVKLHKERHEQVA